MPPQGHGEVVTAHRDEAEAHAAEALGRLVMAFARLDHALVTQIRTELRIPDGKFFKHWGGSGGQLADALRQAAGEDEDLLRVAEEYETLYSLRSHAVHGVWFRDPAGPSRFVVAKPERVKASNFDPEGNRFVDKGMGAEWLVDLRHRVERLQDAINEAFVRKLETRARED